MALMLSALFELLGSFFGLAIKFGFIAIAAVVIHGAVAGYLDTTFGIELPTTFINEGFASCSRPFPQRPPTTRLFELPRQCSPRARVIRFKAWV